MASTVFADRFGCWGVLDLWRDQTSEPFTSADSAFIDSVATSLTTALRECHARTFVEAAAPHRRDLGPVVLTLDEDLQITSRTAASQSWLDLLLPPRPEGRAIPASVYNVAAQLLAVEAGIDDRPASTRVHLGDGFWLTLRAARLASDPPVSDSLAPGTGGIVVTIEEASATERLDLFARAVGLTARETSCSAASPPAVTRGPWHVRCCCRNPRSRTTSSRSSPRPAPAIESPFCPAPSAPKALLTRDREVSWVAGDEQRTGCGVTSHDCLDGPSSSDPVRVPIGLQNAVRRCLVKGTWWGRQFSAAGSPQRLSRATTSGGPRAAG